MMCLLDVLGLTTELLRLLRALFHSHLAHGRKGLIIERNLDVTFAQQSGI